MRRPPGSRALLGAALIAAIAAAPARPARADTVALTQEDAVARTLARHPALRASSQSVAVAEARVALARTGWLPRVTLEGTYRYAGPLAELSFTVDAPVPIPPIERELGSHSYASTGIKAGWRAFDFGARDARAGAAGQAVQASRAEGRERAVELAWATRAAYAAAVFAAEVEAVTERSLDTAREELAAERIRREAGIGEDLSVAAGEARVAELEARLVDARESRARALSDLRLLLGLPEGTTVQPTDSLAALAAPAEAAPAEHPSLARLVALEAAVSLEREAVGRARLPVVDLFAQASIQYPENQLASDGWGPAYAAGVLVTWELFDGDLKRRQRRELGARRAELSALRDAATEEIARKDAQARSRLQSAGAAIAATERSAAAAELYQRAARAALDAGTGTSLEVQKAEEAVDRARLATARARFDAALARADRLRALGFAEGRSER